jgi:signal transduction histidine kinase/CheY-like chemotaxis protein
MANNNENNLVPESRYYQLIAQASGDVFFSVSFAENRFTWRADLGHEFMDYLPGELDPQPENFEHWIHPSNSEVWQTVWADLLRGKPVSIELRLKRKDNQGCWVHMVAVPVEQEEHTGRAVGLVRKTQHIHAVQEDLAEARRLQTVGTMASGIAHEFNNHLTPIRGFVELALDHLGADHPVSEGLQTALDRVEYCAELVYQIQAYGRKSLLLPEPVDAKRLLPSVIRIAISTTRQGSAPITLKEKYPEDMPVLWVDQAQFQQGVVQLVKNAMEAMPDGGTLTVRAESIFVGNRDSQGLKEARSGAFVCISIIDSGVGISQTNLEHIFDPFFTTHNRVDKRGLGLSMVQGMVAQHGGWLEIRTEEGRGTEVRMFLPLRKEARKDAEPIVDADGTMQVLPAAPLGKMLVGDDETLIRSLVRKVFEGEGWSVEECASFDDVLSHVRSDSFDADLLVLDLTMSGPPVEDVVEEVVKLHPDVKILIISGFGRDKRVEHLLEVSKGEFVGKPFSPKNLLSKVDELMAQKP